MGILVIFKKEMQEMETRYEKSLRLLDEFLRETSSEELKTLIDKYDKIGIEGPTFDEYLKLFGNDRQRRNTKRFKEADQKKRTEREEALKKAWENLVIENEEDIPHLPKPLTDYHYEKLFEAGVIRKEDLEDGKMYLGKCRNADTAIWFKDRNVFVYMRHKFGTAFPEEINHLEDDDGFDLFVPIKKIDI